MSTKQTRPIGKHGGKRTVSQHTRADGNTQTANRVGGKFDDKESQDGAAAAATPFVEQAWGRSGPELIEAFEQSENENFLELEVEWDGIHVTSLGFYRDTDNFIPVNTVGLDVGETVDLIDYVSQDVIDEDGDELDRAKAVIEAAYEDWFEGQVTHDDVNSHGQLYFDMSMTLDGPSDEELSEQKVDDIAWDRAAKIMNETDRGTYGSQWIGHDIESRLEVANTPEVLDGLRRLDAHFGELSGTVKIRESGAYLIHATAEGTTIIQVAADGDIYDAEFPVHAKTNFRDFDETIAEAAWDTRVARALPDKEATES